MNLDLWMKIQIFTDVSKSTDNKTTGLPVVLHQCSGAQLIQKPFPPSFSKLILHPQSGHIV